MRIASFFNWIVFRSGSAATTSLGLPGDFAQLSLLITSAFYFSQKFSKSGRVINENRNETKTNRTGPKALDRGGKNGGGCMNKFDTSC